MIYEIAKKVAGKLKGPTLSGTYDIFTLLCRCCVNFTRDNLFCGIICKLKIHASIRTNALYKQASLSGPVVLFISFPGKH
jgi:hypothetical protein